MCVCLCSVRYLSPKFQSKGENSRMCLGFRVYIYITPFPMCRVFSLVCLHFNYSSGESHDLCVFSVRFSRERPTTREKQRRQQQQQQRALRGRNAKTGGVVKRMVVRLFSFVRFRIPIRVSGFQFDSPIIPHSFDSRDDGIRIP